MNTTTTNHTTLTGINFYDDDDSAWQTFTMLRDLHAEGDCEEEDVAILQELADHFNQTI